MGSEVQSLTSTLNNYSLTESQRNEDVTQPIQTLSPEVGLSESVEQPQGSAHDSPSDITSGPSTQVLLPGGQDHRILEAPQTSSNGIQGCVGTEPTPPRSRVSVASGASGYSFHEETTTETVSLDDTQHPNHCLPLKHSLGVDGLVTIFGGLIGIFAILGFLAFLWFGYGPLPEAARATHAWRQIALHDWMAQSITLSALVIRFIVSLHAAVCTSMVASLILEKRSVRRSQASHFSIFRGINDGPIKLLKLMVSSKTAMLGYPEFWLLLLAFLGTLALQFTSTILLSDLNDFTIIGDKTSTQVPSLLSYDKEDFGFRLVSGFVNRLPIYQMFAEAPLGSDATPDSKGLSDTGLLQRGFLPAADDDDRTALREYDGNLLTMNSRVACVKPLMNISYESVEVAADTNFLVVTGQLYYLASLEAAGVSAKSSCTSPECSEVPFRCTLPFAHSTEGGWQSVACFLGGIGGNQWGIDLDPKWDPADEPWAPNSTIYLVFTSNMRRVDWDPLPKADSLESSATYGEWISFEPAADRGVNTSVCFAGFNMDRKLVHLTAESTLQEPKTNWSLTSSKYDTTDVQRFYGVDVPHRSHGERGILTMDIIGQPNDGPPGAPAHDNIILDSAHGRENHSVADLTTRVFEELVDYALSKDKNVNTTLLLCFACDGWADLQHPILAMLLNSIIANTGRAANAIASYNTVMASTWFDAYRSSLRQTQNATIISTKTVRTPGPCVSRRSCGGFYSVVALVTAHVIYVLVITVLFARQAQYSRLNNVWYTVSQLVAGETTVPLQKGNEAGDRSVAEFLKAEGDEYDVKLGRTPTTGRVEIIRCQSKCNL